MVVCGLLDFMTPAFTQYKIAGLAPKVKLIPIAAGRAGINWLVFLGCLGRYPFHFLKVRE